MNKFILATMLLLAAFAIPALAKPHTFGQQLNAAKCDPGTSKMVLNIVFQVTGDADSGQGGNYWALDSYMKHVQVWDMTDGTFCVQVKYNGSFVTVLGRGPGNTGDVAAGVTGTMEGGYSAIISGGSFTPGTKRTKGNIGSKDYACTTAGAPGDCNYYSFLTDYFPGATLAQGFWGWTYRAGENGTWVNSITGNEGDITGTP